MSTKYDLAMPYVFSNENNSAEVKSAVKSYYGTTANITPPTFESIGIRTPEFDEPIDLSPAHISRIEQPQPEAPMTDQNVSKTKQKLAQMIMNELDALGPREEHTHGDGEHTHEHGAHTHVH